MTQETEHEELHAEETRLDLASRIEGERTRARHAAERLQTHARNLHHAIDDELPFGTEVGSALVQVALEVAMTMARLDILLHAETARRAEARMND